MKYSSIRVGFTDPVKELKDDLQRKNARGVSISRNYNGEVEVRYTIKVNDPEKEIMKILEANGAKNISMTSSYNGGNFNFRIDDIIDEREFNRRLSDALRRLGYRVN